MSKPRVTRLKRLESFINVESVLGAQAVRKITDVTSLSRLSVVGAQTFNLPAATGKGGLYRYFVGITATGSKIWKAAGTDLIQGQCTNASSGTPSTFVTAANTNTITFNGTTSGGVIGSMVELWDAAPGVWAVQVSACASGVATTCFSNT